ncbi:hypothetical protein PsorP6_018279 [Peronosclerospora sorghi]|nr:hypothetical protein PsorP6_018279 [Peronosclerospora sorghi]
MYYQPMTVKERQHVAKPVRINELVIEDYYSKIRTVDDETDESPGAFLMESEPTADATETDDPWFVSASPEKGAMLYKEKTAR